MSVDTAELRKLARKLYAEHHGHQDRAEDFAREVIDRAEVFDFVSELMTKFPNSAARKQRRTDLDAISSTARKLGQLLARNDVRCNFPMHDGRVIGYRHVLEQLERQVSAEREALKQQNNRGRPRYDIAAASAGLRTACLLFEVPPEFVLHFLQVIAPEADDKTLQARAE